MIKLIVAIDENGNIGNNDQLPWYSPTDLKRFKTLTTGGAVVMGRKTWESLGRRAGLPNRLNIVLTSAPKNIPVSTNVCAIETCDWLMLDGVKALVGERDVWIIGGAQIYQRVLEMGIVDQIYLTRIHGTFQANIAFPYTIEPNDLAPRIGACTFKQTDYLRPQINDTEPRISYTKYHRVSQ